ncbi:hypothetical protein YC2023_066657 [Brassica napus]
MLDWILKPDLESGFDPRSAPKIKYPGCPDPNPDSKILDPSKSDPDILIFRSGYPDSDPYPKTTNSTDQTDPNLDTLNFSDIWIRPRPRPRYSYTEFPKRPFYQFPRIFFHMISAVEDLKHIKTRNPATVEPVDFDEDLTMTLEENEVNDNIENQNSEYDFIWLCASPLFVYLYTTWFHRFGSKTRCIRETRERGRTWNQIDVIRDKAMVGLRENTPVETLTQRSDNVHHPLSGRDGSNLGKASFLHLIWQEHHINSHISLMRLNVYEFLLQLSEIAIPCFEQHQPQILHHETTISPKIERNCKFATNDFTKNFTKYFCFSYHFTKNISVLNGFFLF